MNNFQKKVSEILAQTRGKNSKQCYTCKKNCNSDCLCHKHNRKLEMENYIKKIFKI